MNTREKLAMLEDMLELDEGSLEENTILEDIEEWDSMSKLSLIVTLDDEYGKIISADHIKEMKTVKDILAIMG